MNRSPVFFVGAGPGDPELITLKGRRLLDQADLVIYAGSLVNPELLTGVDCEIVNSAGLTLEEIVTLMVEHNRAGHRVVRLHTGDPSLYGAIREQMQRLTAAGVAFEIVPGVSSAFAAAASLQIELTVPEVSQTVIFTRQAGRTPVPKRERLAKLAAAQATMLIFLSVSMIETVVSELLAGGYPPETPAAVVERASWPQERRVRGTLADIAHLVKEAGIRKTAMIVVGQVLATGEAAASLLYDAGFSHEYRKGGHGKK